MLNAHFETPDGPEEYVIAECAEGLLDTGLIGDLTIDLIEHAHHEEEMENEGVHV